jgi:hypothetical protein
LMGPITSRGAGLWADVDRTRVKGSSSTWPASHRGGSDCPTGGSCAGTGGATRRKTDRARSRWYRRFRPSQSLLDYARPADGRQGAFERAEKTIRPSGRGNGSRFRPALGETHAPAEKSRERFRVGPARQRRRRLVSLSTGFFRMRIFAGGDGAGVGTDKGSGYIAAETGRLAATMSS